MLSTTMGSLLALFQFLQLPESCNVADTWRTVYHPKLVLFCLLVSQWPLCANSIWVVENEDVVVLAEQTIDIFERAVRSLRVEEVDDGHKRRVKDRPNDVKLPLQRSDTDRGDFNNYGALVRLSEKVTIIVHTHEVNNPIGCCAKSSTLSTHAERVDLGWIEPWDTLEANSEKDIVEEEECDGCRCHLMLMRVALLLVESEQHRNQEIAEGLTGRSIHHEVPATPSLNIRNRDQAEEEV